jgi:hypothetical protein
MTLRSITLRGNVWGNKRLLRRPSRRATMRCRALRRQMTHRSGRGGRGFKSCHSDQLSSQQDPSLGERNVSTSAFCGGARRAWWAGTELAKARRNAQASIKALADQHAANALPVIREIGRAGAASLHQITDALNARGVSRPEIYTTGASLVLVSSAISSLSFVASNSNWAISAVIASIWLLATSCKSPGCFSLSK